MSRRFSLSAAQEKQTEELRIFGTPTITFEAVSYMGMVSLCGPITQPPLLRNLSVSELRNIVPVPIAVLPYPVRTQAIERAVRPITETRWAIAGEEAQHGLITAKFRHRKILLTINSKKDLL